MSRVVALFAAASLWIGAANADEPDERAEIVRIVDAAIRPVMQEHDVPGMAVGVVARGRRYVVNYGVADRGSGRAVDDETIFEIGSVSKTFTATLATLAQVSGALSLSDRASRHLPALAGSRFDGISLLDLATYTAGGLPLQFPDSVVDELSMVDYYRHWSPAYRLGSHRLYSNVSIGLFGHLAAASLGRPFDEAMERTLFPALGLTRTFVRVPEAKLSDYAFGYAKDGAPIRVNPGVLGSEAYGVKSTAGDMLGFIAANIDGAGLADPVRQAVSATHVGYVRLGDMVQCLGWERYAYPITIDRLLAGNAPQVILEANAVTKLDPPLQPDAAMLIDKTGSTNGFGAYVAVIPSKGVGVVLLANRAYPIPARVTAAYRILTAVDHRQGEATGR